MSIEELLKEFNFDTIEQLYDYLIYLNNVKDDYEFLKNKIKNLARDVDNLY